MSRLLLCAGQMQLIQVKLDQGQLQHPREFCSREEFDLRGLGGCRGTNEMGMRGMFKSVTAGGDCIKQPSTF